MPLLDRLPPDPVLPIGTRVQHRVFRDSGTVVKPPDRPEGHYTVKPDDPHHHSGRVLIMGKEIVTVTQAAIEDAEYEVESAKWDHESATKRLAWARSERDKATKRLRKARAELRKAQKADREASCPN